MNSSSYYVLAIDIEASGSSKKRNGIVSIGASLQDKYSNELTCFQANLALAPGKVYDEKCLTSFWQKNMDAYKFVQTNQLEPAIATKNFTNFLSEVEKNYNQHGKLKIVSDNPRFDIAWTNDYIDEYTDHHTLDYNMFGEYRFVWDINSMMKVLLSITRPTVNADWGLVNRLGIRSKWQADHNPLNDARTIADYYNQVTHRIKSLGSSYEYGG